MLALVFIWRLQLIWRKTPKLLLMLWLRRLSITWFRLWWALSPSRLHSTIWLGIIPKWPKQASSTEILHFIKILIVGHLVLTTNTTLGILNLMKDNGPANTGLTLVWMPVFFENFSNGRAVCIGEYFKTWILNFSLAALDWRLRFINGF